MKDITLTVTPARSRRAKTVLASALPSWAPRIRWNAISAVLNCNDEVPPTCAIQCAVIAKYGFRLLSDQISAVNETLPTAFYMKPGISNM